MPAKLTLDPLRQAFGKSLAELKYRLYSLGWRRGLGRLGDQPAKSRNDRIAFLESENIRLEAELYAASDTIGSLHRQIDPDGCVHPTFETYSENVRSSLMEFLKGVDSKILTSDALRNPIRLLVICAST